MRTMLVTFGGVGLLFIVLAVPLILERVPPNLLYGFRVPATLNDPDLWYPVNRRTGWLLLGAGVVDIAAAALLYRPLHAKPGAYAMVMAGVMLGTALLMAAGGFLYLHQLRSR